MRPVRHHLGITAFGANAWTVENVGDRLMPEHEEDEGSEELYVVLRGRARFEIGGESVDAPQGTLVFVGRGHEPDRVRRGGRDDGARDRQHGRKGVRGRRVGGLGAGAHAVRGRRVRGRDREGPRRRSRRTRSTARRSTTSPAARRSPATRRTRSATSVRRSSGGRDLRELAREDSDFDSIRDEPAFKELVA